MKHLTIIIGMLVISSAIFAQKEITEFRGIKWDTPFSEISEGMVKAKTMTPGFKGFAKEGDDMNFAGAEAHHITYMFKKNLLYGVCFAYYRKDLETVVENITAKYGEPKATETFLLDNYEWMFEKTMITLTVFKTGEEANNMLNIGKKRTRR